MKFAALIFDMDGLLVDSEPVWHEVETEMIESCGYTYTDEVRELTIGVRVDEFAAIIHRHYPKVAATPAAVAETLLQRIISLPRAKIKARPGADAIIRYAAENNIPRAIASSSTQAVIEHFIGILGWDDLLPQRYSAQFVARGKPAPDIYLHAAAQIGIAPPLCLALEDSRAGTQAALQAGMTCFTVPDLSHSSLSDFEDLNPHLFESLHSVLDAFKTRGLFA